MENNSRLYVVIVFVLLVTTPVVYRTYIATQSSVLAGLAGVLASIISLILVLMGSKYFNRKK